MKFDISVQALSWMVLCEYVNKDMNKKISETEWVACLGKFSILCLDEGNVRVGSENICELGFCAWSILSLM